MKTLVAHVVALASLVSFAPLTAANPCPPTGGGAEGLGDLGRRVDISGERFIAATITDVTIVNHVTNTVEAVDLLANGGLLIDEVYDVAIEGDVASVVSRDNVGNQVMTTYGYSAESMTWNLSITAMGAPGQSEVELRDGFQYLLRSDPLGTLLAITDVDNLLGGQLLPTESTFFLSAETIALAVGDGPGGPGTDTSILLTTETAGIRELRGFSFDGSQLTDYGIIVQESPAIGFGDALAIDDGFGFVGAPFIDIGAIDGGLVAVLVDDGTGTFQGAGLITSTQAGDNLGRALAVEGEVLLIGEVESETVPVAGVGSVRVMRLNAAGTAWDPTAEVFHAGDGDFSFARDFGAAIAVDAGRIAVGAPGDALNAGEVFVFGAGPAPEFMVGLSPGLAGFGGMIPLGLPGGSTQTGALASISVSGARPSSPAFVIAGFTNLNAPLKGGILTPSLDVIRALGTNIVGELVLAFEWPAGAPGPYDVFAQVWIQDADGPVGFAATQGFKFTHY